MIFKKSEGENIIKSLGKSQLYTAFTVTNGGNFRLPFTVNRSLRFGFTLAEVLVTLGIIGVVAAMTIPTLVKNYQKNVTSTRLKKTYSIINSVLNQAAADNGITLKELFQYDDTLCSGGSALRDALTTGFVHSYFLPYIKISEDCAFSRIGTCQIEMKGLQGSNGIALSSNYKLNIADGSSVYFVPDNNGTIWLGMIITMDINGNQGPNTIGKDIFQMRYSSNSTKVNFAGDGLSRNTILTNTPSGCNKNAWGTYCGALIMYDNWKIADDYPWN